MKSKFILVATLLISVHSFAWGPIGHRAGGLIAQENLTPQAKVEVAKLLGKENLGDVANWADEIKSGSQYKQAIWYHFEKIEDDDTYIETLQATPEAARKRGGLMAAILLSEDILRSKKASTLDKTVALKFLVHFVGDLHQPLHSGRPADKGGVTLPVTWFGMQTSLHGVWDSRMIKTGHEDIFTRAAQRADDGATYAEYLQTELKNTKVDTKTHIEGWLEESMALRLGAYDKTYVSDQTRYQSIHLKEIDVRVYESGLRLAAMLNDIYAGAPFPTADSDLHKRVENIVGSLDKIVNYKP
ncbi:MAG: S1/P1 nuclease [Bdellovibrionota bacterium]|mgnify:CR=1 FL=1